MWEHVNEACVRDFHVYVNGVTDALPGFEPVEERPEPVWFCRICGRVKNGSRVSGIGEPIPVKPQTLVVKDSHMWPVSRVVWLTPVGSEWYWQTTDDRFYHNKYAGVLAPTTEKGRAETK